ncbi:sulfite exporter TauE/SafE family protein [Rhodoblastus acidophilus]|uniref:Probable membrane transporter protein n=1 Tax=Candidatus Rhodoblastus alkanivorans TaxID=2954117 RepID=A0ABS9Z9K7_9HYPH|nr:sulfite exporter TauE/SafE family protein [Candidatus Rhodoblastus alkanivorans]MCI4680687.1 sulfite exporter TauE/SafE family protein [Candidatus Rhodoblastus alkanivorans]MCI4684374.1 sulfite exporter TauE/SafE family protein [Candidatus Rhodoblastus alkanivorans]MDI4641695.1 sulfite exporter TauE/SafE family protein [Rhodoblastus acidophilus]
MHLSYLDGAALLSGVIVGFVLGLIGGGGSVFATPLLYYFVGVANPHVAIGTGAAAVAVNALANLLGHARAGRVKWACAAIFAAAGSGGAIIGSSLGKIVDGQKLLLLFGVVMLVVAAQMAIKRPPPQGHDFRLTRENAGKTVPALVLIGLVVGVLSGFFGIGGGFLVVPGILAATGMPMIAAIGSSLVSVTAFGAATAANYAWSGLVDWPVTAFLVAGGVVGGVFGGRLAGVLAARRQLLTQVFAALVAAVGIYVIYRGVLVLMKP